LVVLAIGCLAFCRLKRWFWKKINVREYRRGNKKMDNPEKLATWGTQDDEKQSKHTTQ